MVSKKTKSLIECINGGSEEPVTEEDVKDGRIKFKKFLIEVYDIDLYHQIAQTKKTIELSQVGGIHYILGIQNGGDNLEPWTVRLAEGRDSEFLEKYRQYYIMASRDPEITTSI